MYVKAIKYTDYNGEEKVKNFYFNLTKTEITKMNLSADGGMKEFIRKMVNESDNKKIFDLFEQIVLMAYGEKSPDGEEFLKSDSIRERFQCHPAYDVLLMQLLEGGEKSIGDFINAVVPNDISSKITDKDREEIMREIIPSVDETKPELKPVK